MLKENSYLKVFLLLSGIFLVVFLYFAFTHVKEIKLIVPEDYINVDQVKDNPLYHFVKDPFVDENDLLREKEKTGLNKNNNKTEIKTNKIKMEALNNKIAENNNINDISNSEPLISVYLIKANGEKHLLTGNISTLFAYSLDKQGFQWDRFFEERKDSNGAITDLALYTFPIEDMFEAKELCFAKNYTDKPIFCMTNFAIQNYMHIVNNAFSQIENEVNNLNLANKHLSIQAKADLSPFYINPLNKNELYSTLSLNVYAKYPKQFLSSEIKTHYPVLMDELMLSLRKNIIIKYDLKQRKIQKIAEFNYYSYYPELLLDYIKAGKDLNRFKNTKIVKTNNFHFSNNFNLEDWGNLRFVGMGKTNNLYFAIRKRNFEESLNDVSSISSYLDINNDGLVLSLDLNKRIFTILNQKNSSVIWNNFIESVKNMLKVSVPEFYDSYNNDANYYSNDATFIEHEDGSIDIYFNQDSKNEDDESDDYFTMELF